MYHNNRASSLKRVGRIEEAIEQYQNLIQEFTDYGKAYLSLASTYIEIGKYQEAVKSYRLFMRAYKEGRFNFNPVFAGINQTVNSHNILETVILTSINYLSHENKKLAIQAFTIAYESQN